MMCLSITDPFIVRLSISTCAQYALCLHCVLNRLRTHLCARTEISKWFDVKKRCLSLFGTSAHQGQGVTILYALIICPRLIRGLASPDKIDKAGRKRGHCNLHPFLAQRTPLMLQSYVSQTPFVLYTEGAMTTTTCVFSLCTFNKIYTYG